MSRPAQLKPVRPLVIRDLNRMIGNLDRMLSEFLHYVEEHDLDVVDGQTLKHHADDLIGVGKHALSKLKKRGVK